MKISNVGRRCGLPSKTRTLLNSQRPLTVSRRLISKQKYRRTKITPFGIRKGRTSMIYKVLYPAPSSNAIERRSLLKSWALKFRRLKRTPVIRAVSHFTTVSTNKYWKRNRQSWQMLERQANSIAPQYQKWRLPSPPWAS